MRTRDVLPAFTAATAAFLITCAASSASPDDATRTATPIKHVVIIFNENVSLDHYFATYPRATNPPGEPHFVAAAGTPGVNNLASANLLRRNPNTNPANDSDVALPFRLDRTQANTQDQNHAYTAEQQAYNGGRMDLFPKYTGKGTPGGAGAFGTKGQVMGYFDGNTVAAMWQYAQHFAMNDNAWTDTYGPSTPGMLELVAGQTNGMKIVATTKQPSTLAAVSYYVADGQGGWTMINDVDPGYDTCSVPQDQAMMTGKNIGDLLNAAGVTWGGFHGWIQSGDRECQWHHRMQAQYTVGDRRQGYRGLRSAPQLVPVFRLYGEPDACASQLGWDHRPWPRT
jgi:phospholipase C